jgi:hypothetical protein
MTFPSKEIHRVRLRSALEAARLFAPPVERLEGEDITKALARCFISDRSLIEVPGKGKDEPVRKTIFALGRIARYIAGLLGNESALDGAGAGLSAHNFEEIASQPQMRRINFAEATYRGVPPRSFPG